MKRIIDYILILSLIHCRIKKNRFVLFKECSMLLSSPGQYVSLDGADKTKKNIDHEERGGYIYISIIYRHLFRIRTCQIISKPC